MVAATRAAGDKEGNGEDGESDDDAYEEGDGGGNEGGGRQRRQWRGQRDASPATSKTMNVVMRQIQYRM